MHKDKFMIEVVLESTTHTQGVLSYDLPLSITLSSSAVTRKIELTTDGSNYFVPTLDVTDAAFLVCSIGAPLHSVKVTGLVGDKLTIIGESHGLS